jgi:hypothetical protein
MRRSSRAVASEPCSWVEVIAPCCSLLSLTASFLPMGRTLFSQNYPTAPTSQQGDPDVRAYETWSKSNPFDPDSDEFFVDAVYEAFVDAEYERQREEQLREDDEENRATIAMQIDTDSGVSLSSGSPLLSSRGSPMAVGADDPAVILADAGYATPSEWNRSSSAVSGYTGWMHMGRIAMPEATTGYLPPLSIEEEIMALHSAARLNRLRSTSISAPQDQLPTIPSRRTVTITPIDVTPVDRRPSVPRSPSPTPLQTPPRRENVQLPDLITPSPAPTVTPHVYRWHTSTAPWMSPTPRSTAPVAQASPSPLPNQSARVSHSRIALAPVHLRMQSAAI